MEKSKNNILLLSIIVLTIFATQTLSFITFRYIDRNFSNVVTNTENEILTVSELALYLKITEAEVENLIMDDMQKKIQMRASGSSSWDTYSFIPYLELGGKKLFLKSEIDKWFEYQIYHAS